MGYSPKYLGHVNIYVRNAERSQKWYEDILGLHTYDFVPGRAAFMSANKEESHEVALMEVGDNAPGQEKGQVGLNHMAWKMENLRDLKEFYHRLKVKNVPMNVTDHGISLGIYFRDPDGKALRCTMSLPATSGTARRNSSCTVTGPRATSPVPGMKCWPDSN